MKHPLQIEVDRLNAVNKLLVNELEALREYRRTIEPVLRNAITTAMQLKAESNA